MNRGKYVFAQLFEFVSHNDFLKCVNKYDGNYKTKHFSCWKQFLCMAFGQLTHRESLSDTILCLGANEAKLYHLVSCQLKYVCYFYYIAIKNDGTLQSYPYQGRA